MLASRRRISPFGANSHSSFPYERHHRPDASRLSYWKRTAIRSSAYAHSDLRSA